MSDVYIDDAADRSAEDTVPVSQLETSPWARPAPHGEKLVKLLENRKLPRADGPRVKAQIKRYNKWLSDMDNLSTEGSDKVRDLVQLLNEYKKSVELDLIWDSHGSFLYRQKGQLKLDNSILEEWFPWLVDVAIIPELEGVALEVGPAKAFASAYFQSILAPGQNSPGLTIRSKDQDFTIGRPTYIHASFSRGMENADIRESYVAYIAAELKTNLDKTMFEGAMTTSHDLAIAAPGSHYFLICEYLDMTPISSAGTDIEQVFILLGKRRSSTARKNFADADYRRSRRSEFADDLDAAPVRLEVVKRFVDEVREILREQVRDVSDAVERGYL